MFLTRLLHIPQIALSAYGLYLSTIAITQLRQYEATSEKAAEYSGEAERQLHKTRTTQASGAVCVSFPPFLLRFFSVLAGVGGARGVKIGSGRFDCCGLIGLGRIGLTIVVTDPDISYRVNDAGDDTELPAFSGPIHNLPRRLGPHPLRPVPRFELLEG